MSAPPKATARESEASAYKAKGPITARPAKAKLQVSAHAEEPGRRSSFGVQQRFSPPRHNDACSFTSPANVHYRVLYYLTERPGCEGRLFVVERAMSLFASWCMCGGAVCRVHPGDGGGRRRIR